MIKLGSMSRSARPIRLKLLQALMLSFVWSATVVSVWHPSSALANRTSPTGATCPTTGAPGTMAINEPALEPLIHSVSEFACTMSANQTPVDDSLLMGLLRGSGQCAIGLGGGVINLAEGLGAFVKLLVVEAPAALWRAARDKLRELWASSPNAASGAAVVASENADAQATLLQRAQAYYVAFQKFISQAADSIRREYRDYQCLPAHEQSRILCRLISEVFLVVVSPEKIIQGAKWTYDFAQASSAMLRQLRNNPALREMSAADRMRAATQTLAVIETRGRELRRFRDANLVEYTNARGDRVLKLEETVTLANGQRGIVAREVLVDAKTGAIDANTEVGRALMERMVSEGSQRSSLIFVDVNNLGKVNYFREGTTAGDRYLAVVGESIRGSIRPGDLFFKAGGDELVMILNTSDPAVVQRVSERIVQQVGQHRELSRMFSTEVAGQSEIYRQIARARSVDDLPQAVRARLSADELARARQDFANAQSQLLSSQVTQIQAQASIRPSVSIGSTTLRQDSLATALQRAEAQATAVKVEYKAAIGLDTSKYGTTPGGAVTSRPDYRARPQVRPPVAPSGP
jgi:GGDEF domain-containing protein